MEDEGLPFPGSDFFELITAYQTPPDAWFFSFPPFLVLLLWLAPLGTASGTRPRCCTPIC